MTNLEKKLKGDFGNEKETNSVSSFYFDVNLCTENKTIEASIV